MTVAAWRPVLLAAEQLKDAPCRVTLLFTAQEEVGTRGAKTALFDRGVDASVSVDVSFAYTPGCKARDCGVMARADDRYFADFGSAVQQGTAGPC